MAVVMIIRINEFANRYRDIRLYINGNKAGMISNSQAREFIVPPGTHTLQAKIDWCSSNKLTFPISDMETKKFNLASFANGKRPNGFSVLYHILFTPSTYLCLTEFKEDSQ